MDRFNFISDFTRITEPFRNTIVGVNTTTTGFVGTAEKGEFDRPTLITSWNEFVDK